MTTAKWQRCKWEGCITAFHKKQEPKEVLLGLSLPSFIQPRTDVHSLFVALGQIERHPLHPMHPLQADACRTLAIERTSI